MPGFIKVDRDTVEWLRGDPVKLGWWIDILMEVNIAPKQVMIKGHLYDCQRGECLYSLDTWAKRWRTDKSSVRRFFDALKNRHAIDTQTDTRTTRLKINLSMVYEEEKHAISTPSTRRPTPTERIKNKEEKKEEENTAIDPFTFELFWDLYDKKVGLRDKVKKKWDGLPAAEKEQAIRFIPAYKDSQPEKRFRKDPETFINNKSWNDEIIPAKNQTNGSERKPSPAAVGATIGGATVTKHNKGALEFLDFLKNGTLPDGAGKPGNPG